MLEIRVRIGGNMGNGGANVGHQGASIGIHLLTHEILETIFLDLCITQEKILLLVCKKLVKL